MNAEIKVEPEYTVEELIEMYIKLRDKKAELEGSLKSKVAKINEAMEMVEGQLLLAMDNLGVDKLAKKGVGTAFLATKEFVGVENWSEVEAYVLGTSDLSLLNKAVNKTRVREYMAEHEGHVPPGVSYTTRKEVSVRRA
jgi:hypothetical protein